jgi:dihydroorotate dehydrogenase
MLYRALIRPLLFAMPPETAHRVAFGGLRAAMATPGVGALSERVLAPRDPALEVRALGLTFPTPVGLAAGFDKDAVGVDALSRIGFGFVEVGTLTAHPQPGNPAPRMFRLPADRAIVNRMGFNNRGSADAAARLARPRRVPVGVNIGKSKVTPEERAAEDYATSAERLARLADYLVVNVSSPNTPGLRDLQAVEKLRPILRAVREASERASEEAPPLLVKIAPDLSDEDVDAVAELALELGLDGIVATNTTIRREGLASAPDAVRACGAGGLSGAPLKTRALEVLRRLHRRACDRLVLLGVGGIESADDAWARVLAGASLVQLYTGFIYGGPLSPRDVALGLAERARAAGYARVQDAVGAGARERTEPPAGSSADVGGAR